MQVPRKDFWGGQSSELQVCSAWQRSCSAAEGLGSPVMSDWNWFCQQFYPTIDVEIELGSHILYQMCEMGHPGTCSPP